MFTNDSFASALQRKNQCVRAVLASALLGGACLSPAYSQDGNSRLDSLKGLVGSLKSGNQSPANSAASPSADSAGAVAVSTTIESENVSWQVSGCGYTQTQELTCHVSAINAAGDKRIHVSPGNVRMIDSTGSEYRASSGGFGADESKNPMMVNGLKVSGVFRFRSVDPRAQSVSRLIISGAARSGSLTFANIPIQANAGSGATGSGGLLGGLLGDTGKQQPAAGTTTTASSGSAKPAQSNGVSQAKHDKPSMKDMLSQKLGLKP